MYILKENVKIVLKQEGVIITQKSLAINQDEALLIMNNPVYKEKYGHNLVIKGQQPVDTQDEITIPVNLKKKAEVEFISEELQDTASTSTEAHTGGMNLNLSGKGQQSQSTGSQQSKQGTGNQSSQQKKSAASGRTGK